MSLVGFRARNHPQQVDASGADRDIDDRAITLEDFAPLATRFRFTLDAAATPQNARCPKYFTAADDGLAQSWAGETVWCNPPYSRLRPWAAKAWAEHATARGIVLLLPANRAEQNWWQQLIEPYRDRPGSPLTVEFLPGRLRFLATGQRRIQPNERPPFGCCLAVWSVAGPAPTPQQLLLGGEA
jgi:phage N-6-adenine-methyltransferase